MKIFIDFIFFVMCSLVFTSYSLANDILAEDFDRLFTTADERKKLDLAREQGHLFKKSMEPDVDSLDKKPVVKPSLVKLSGIILRADGKAQVWLSGQPLYASLKQLNANKTESSELRIPLTEKSISLKPGQVVMNGKAKESYYFVTQSASSSLTPNEPESVSSFSASSASSSLVSSQVSENAQTKKP